MSRYGEQYYISKYSVLRTVALPCKRTRILCALIPTKCQVGWAGHTSQSYVVLEIIMQNQGGPALACIFCFGMEFESCNMMGLSLHWDMGAPLHVSEEKKKKWVDALTRSVEDRMRSDLMLDSTMLCCQMHRGRRLKKASHKKPTQTRGVYWKNGHHLVATPAVAPGPADE